MITTLSTHNTTFKPLDPLTATALPANLTWLDIESPNLDVEQKIEKLLGFDLLTAEEMKNIEPSSRLFQEKNVIYMTANLVWNAEGDEPVSGPVSFLMAGNALVTLRFSNPRAFVAYKAHVARQTAPIESGAAVFVGLLEAIIDRNAELLEKLTTQMDATSRSIFVPIRSKGLKRKKRPTTENLEEMLVEIAYTQNLTAKIRESLVSIGRMVSFYIACTQENAMPHIKDHLITVQKDAQSLTEHASYISNNITFLLDSCLGFINIEQNAIIKIFSVASVIFLPPTLVASIYGMNFKFMPELGWEFGFPYAILLMVISAAVPFWYFKKRGWL